MSATAVTFRRRPAGWVAHGPAHLMHLGPVEVHKADGSTCPQVALALGEPVEEDGVLCRVAYLAEGCGKAHAPAPPTRADRLAELVERYKPLDPPEAEGVERWVLVEESRIDGSHYLTACRTPADASRQWGGQECPEDWEPVMLVNLDTGTEHRATPTYGLTFEGVDQ